MNKLFGSIEHPIAHALGILIGGLIGNFFWAVALFYAYEWISWNFNLPAISYLGMVCMYTSFQVICSTIRKIFPTKS